MKKSNLIKLFSILLISVMVMMFTTNVLAADNDTNGFSDLTNTINNTNTDNANNTNTNNANTNTNKTNTNTNNTNNTNKTNNSSVYNNTNLPSTGIEDSIPVALLVVVFGISAVYAYRKIKEYRNI